MTLVNFLSFLGLTRFGFLFTSGVLGASFLLPPSRGMFQCGGKHSGPLVSHPETIAVCPPSSQLDGFS